MTVAILAVVTSWNAFLLPLIVLNDPNEWTLPLGVAAYQGEYTQDTATILAYTALEHGPGAALLRGRRAADRRRAVGRRQGLTRPQSCAATWMASQGLPKGGV